MRCLVIIPMYGQESYTDKCIEFTRKNAGIDHDILIVDDGSKKPYIGRCVNVIRLEKNSGFTAAVNAGILWAQKRGYDYVLLLNNDTEPCKDFLLHLVTEMEKSPDIGITSSVRINIGKKDEPVALAASDLVRGFQYFCEEDKLPKDAFETNIIPVASGLLRMDMVREIGLLDKRYKNHCSDTELCVRARLKGWKVMLVPDSRVRHHLSVTTTANNILVDDDQRLWIEELACLGYAKLMTVMPLDGEAKTWGRLNFEVYQK